MISWLPSQYSCFSRQDYAAANPKIDESSRSFRFCGWRGEVVWMSYDFHATTSYSSARYILSFFVFKELYFLLCLMTAHLLLTVLHSRKQGRGWILTPDAKSLRNCGQWNLDIKGPVICFDLEVFLSFPQIFSFSLANKEFSFRFYIFKLNLRKITTTRNEPSTHIKVNQKLRAAKSPVWIGFTESIVSSKFTIRLKILVRSTNIYQLTKPSKIKFTTVVVK